MDELRSVRLQINVVCGQRDILAKDVERWKRLADINGLLAVLAMFLNVVAVGAYFIFSLPAIPGVPFAIFATVGAGVLGWWARGK